MYEQLPDKSLPPATFAPREPRLRRPPFWATSLIMILIVGSWVPLVLIARARVTPSEQPRVSFVQDMASQPKYKEQQSSPIFNDGRADRLPIAGTVARGRLDADDFYFRGFSKSVAADGKAQVKFFEGYPSQVHVDEALLHRGQERFNIYCQPCHGLDGSGNGAVHVRAQELGESKWVPPSNLTADGIRARPNGHLFNTITLGIRNMPGYGSQIEPADRWAIIAYVRALQMSQNSPADSLSQEQRASLK